MSPDTQLGHACLLGEVAELITDEATDYVGRLISLADGQLVTNTEPVPLPLSPSPPPTVRVYSRPPHQTAIEYIINRALGVPGADLDCYETTESCSERMQATKDHETGADYSQLILNCDQQFSDALPMAIERLKELAAGITVQRFRYGKPYTITRRPNCRAIEFIADRVAGKFGSIISALQERIENPNTERNYTTEEIDAMSEVEKAFLREALERKQKAGQQDKPKRTLPTELPDYVTTANQTLKSFLPEAIKHMKTLARGAQTIIETETERKIFDHEPDSRANTFLINRFMGAPTTYLHIERIVENTEYDKTMKRLAAKYPEIVARYGSIQAALKAHPR